MLYLYNTLSRQKEIFNPIKERKVGLYTCGPTVYNYVHIGNLRTYIFEDLLKRVLKYSGYRVKHVMNITDVGHLTSDADTGEDKMEIGATREGKSAWEIAEFYTEAFKQNLKELNIIEPNIWCKATDHIKEQIRLIRKLEKRGFTYRTNDGIYFDTSKLSDYGKLAKLDLKNLQAGIRVEMVPGKRNPTDFALWKFSPKNKKRQMEWQSPWGMGFPGWHIECAAMAMKYLGKTFDIHCGGTDHIPVHHTNEIAEAEAATGRKFVNYWIHGAFLLIDQSRMGKSEGNFITLQALIDKGFNPIAYRYLCLTAHYRSLLNFSWESLEFAQNTLNKLYQITAAYKKGRVGCSETEKKFLQAINDDLDTPKAIAIVWELIKSNLPSEVKMASLLKFDQVLGLKLKEARQTLLKIPTKIKHLVQIREKMRQEKKWSEADQIRKQMQQLGYGLEDTPEGPAVKRLIF